MNEPTTSGAVTTTKFVLRRTGVLYDNGLGYDPTLGDPFRFLGQEWPPWVWWLPLIAVLVVALVYVVWMYVKDSRGVGPLWAILLGSLRLSVYALLALVFLLPSKQTFIETRSEAKVLVIHDVSGSMNITDELPTGNPSEKLPTRQDKVRDFLTDERVAFLANLEQKNPVTMYRFGTRLDEQSLHFKDGRFFTRQEKENPDRDENGVVILPEKKELSPNYWTAWLNPGSWPGPGGKAEVEVALDKRETERLGKLAEVNTLVVKDGLTRGTNLADSVLAALTKEAASRLQGVVIFTDGRNTESSPRGFADLEARARALRVPIFVVGVGEDREKVKIEIVDVRVPPQVQPEDRFRAVVELTGVGLGGQKVNLTLDLVHTRKGKKGEDELLPIRLIEAEDPHAPRAEKGKDTRPTIDLGKKLELKPATEVVFDKGTPPRAAVEFQLDAAALAAAAGIDLATDDRYKGRKWEIAETEEGEFKFQARVPVDKHEGLKIKEHLSDKAELRVVKKPVRVLLLASAANRDYQFVRSLLVREMDKKRMELAIHLQLPPGVLDPKLHLGRVQDVPPERLLTAFPDTYEAKKTLDDLSSYDVIVAFDPDWERLTREQIQNVRKWSRKGGGLVLIGGSINTVELVRPRDGEEADKFMPLLEMLPVVLDDRRDFLDRKTDDPWPLDLEGATPEMEFLKLDEDLDEAHFKDDWQAFFYGTGKEAAKKEVLRGFYNLYPVLRAKPGSVTVARFGDPSTKLKDGTLQPFLVLSPSATERVVWIGSAETWRLREYKEAFHERFWTKLVRYAGSKSQGASGKHIVPYVAKKQVAGKPIAVEAKIDRQGGDPLERSAKPEITLIETPAGVDEKAKQTVVMLPRTGNSDGWFNGQLVVKVPGNYTLQIKVPETGDTETEKFSVSEANPEMDNTRPDFTRMYALASEADDVLRRMPEADQQALRRRLQRPKLNSSAEEKDSVVSEDKLRLYFDLKNAELIPSCMTSDVQKQTSRGPVHDLWDEGFVVYRYPTPDDPAKPAKPPIKISYVLLGGVFLLSLEWLIRKLLRLA